MASETTAVPGGNRRIDRVLAEDYLTGLRDLPLAEVRTLRSEAEQEETDLSYIRRLLQGRLDVIAAERRRRSGDGTGSIVDDLASILADEPRGAAHGLGRHTTVEPSRADEHRRYVERLVADVDLSDVSARTDAELEEAVTALTGAEKDLSAKRRAVQAVMDACSAEITRRYREGEADVSDILGSEA